MTVSYRQTRFPAPLADRLAKVRDDLTGTPAVGHGEAKLKDALAAVLDWWDATADMRAMGIDGAAVCDLMDIAEQEATR